ncbi:hypothetical protein [Falsirhodobacter halotolerans]|uniref:hypothetical protein n=1 Tax=Falsirhodobacter halotolerans TaxID=1146892 RepID=UPI001FD0068E|nr:hypothetical protein [Falsirhodobacter halotolerans]MCJ8139580.1 hypothetical protein [Falsirhodobacter halotolerans]
MTTPDLTACATCGAFHCDHHTPAPTDNAALVEGLQAEVARLHHENKALRGSLTRACDLMNNSGDKIDPVLREAVAALSSRAAAPTPAPVVNGGLAQAFTEGLEAAADLVAADYICDAIRAVENPYGDPAPAADLTTPPEDVGGWQAIATAPTDGTVIDLWDGTRWTDCYWGVPHHDCGEAGRYCDSDWHSLKNGWVCGTFNEALDAEPTHWMPPPPAPAALAKHKGGA